MKNPFRDDRWYQAFQQEQSAHAVTRTQLVQLTLRLADLQRAGYSVAPPEPSAPTLPRLDPLIVAALNGRFPGQSPHRAMVLRQIDDWLLEQREPAWIARRIWDGEETVDGEYRE